MRGVRSAVSVYVVAGVATAAAVLLRWLLDPWMGADVPLVTLFGAVAVAVWYGGYGPALVATLTGYVACNYLFIEPRGALAIIDGSDALGLVLYLLTCSIIVGFGEAMRRAQRRANDRQEVLRVTFASIGDAVITTDTSGRITELNAAAEELLGRTRHEARGEALDGVLRLVDGPTRQAVENPATRSLREGRVVGPVGERILIRKDGTERRIDESASPIRTPRGQVLGCVLVLRDTSALREAEEMTRAFFDSAAEGIVIVNPAGRIVSVNRRGRQMFGYAGEDFVGQPVEMLLPERFRAAHRGHRGSYFDAPRMRSMGSDFPIEISLSPIDTPDGPLAMALVTDVSERRSLERSARQHEKLAALATLSAGIAHELNNPIGIISTRIELMLQDAKVEPLPPQITEDLHVLHRNIQRVIRIAQGLLSFARQSPEQRGPVIVNGVVEETLLLVGKQLAQDGIRVTVHLDPSLAPIWGDANALQQLVTNLLLNARDAMPGGGDLRIETTAGAPAAGWVRLSVADTGHGMTPESVEKIWEPFYTTKTSGTGLGLSVTHRIIQEHGGNVEVASAPGRGTTFLIGFPVPPAPSATR
jgi:PAS domain S-box-containing protein